MSLLFCCAPLDYSISKLLCTSITSICRFCIVLDIFDDMTMWWHDDEQTRGRDDERHQTAVVENETTNTTREWTITFWIQLADWSNSLLWIDPVLELFLEFVRIFRTRCGIDPSFRIFLEFFFSNFHQVDLSQWIPILLCSYLESLYNIHKDFLDISTAGSEVNGCDWFARVTQLFALTYRTEKIIEEKIFIIHNLIQLK